MFLNFSCRLLITLAIVLLCVSSTLKAQSMSTETSARAPIHIAIIGDSTVCDYPPQRSPLAGWGQLLPEFLDRSGVKVTNYALGGRSSKSFFREKNWEKFLQLDPPADYLFIQFGHNDNHGRGKGPERETLPGPIPAQLPAEGLGSDKLDYYRHNLAVYVAAARAKGTTPILVTPMERFLIDKAGQLDRRNQPYAEATLAVGKELDVLVIDLNAYSAACYAKWSAEEAASHHVTVPDKGLDRTHYNAKGARVWAAFIAGELEKHDKLLGSHLIVNTRP